jgi:hypothetical protein
MLVQIIGRSGRRERRERRELQARSALRLEHDHVDPAVCRLLGHGLVTEPLPDVLHELADIGLRLENENAPTAAYVARAPLTKGMGSE